MEKSQGPRKTYGAQVSIAAAWCLVLTVGVVLLYLGREVLVPIALSILIWFLINALAGTLRASAVFKSVLGPWSCRRAVSGGRSVHRASCC